MKSNLPLVKKEDWQAYIDEPKRALARDLWNKICALYPVPIPHQAAYIPGDVYGTKEQASFQMVWDKQEHHIDVYIDADNSIEWFYWNRTTKKADGGDGVESIDFRYFDLVK